MAKQKGVVRLQGTIDDLTFYESQDGILARKKTSLDKSRIDTDSKFLRTRENNSEFANCATTAKLVRRALHTMTVETADGRVGPRLNGIMLKIKKFDTVSERGFRTVAIGIEDPKAKDLLTGFVMNIHAPLSAVLKSPFELDQATGNITLPRFIPQKGVVFPEGATHLSLQAGYCRLDFESEKTELQVSQEQTLPIDKTSTTVVLNPAAVPALEGTSLYVLKIFFYQEVNGVKYELQNSASSSMDIIAVN